MSTTETRVIVHRFLDALTRRDPADAAGFLTPDIIAHFAGLPEAVQGRDAWRQLFGAYVAAFPDMEIVVHDEIAEGDIAMARWTWRGTHQAPFMGMPATGTSVSGISGLGAYRIADGNIAEEWVVEDTLGLLQQLGAVPAPGQSR
jgi:steroid delta-isomerase-like uncharacterized protein